LRGRRRRGWRWRRQTSPSTPPAPLPSRLRLRHDDRDRSHPALIPRSIDRLGAKLVAAQAELLRETRGAWVKPASVETTAVPEPRPSRLAVSGGEAVNGPRARGRPRAHDSRRCRRRPVGFQRRCRDPGAEKEEPDDPGELGGDFQQEAAPFNKGRHDRWVVGRPQGAPGPPSIECLPDGNPGTRRGISTRRRMCESKKGTRYKNAIQARKPLQIARVDRAVIAPKSRKGKEIGWFLELGCFHQNCAVFRYIGRLNCAVKLGGYQVSTTQVRATPR
jgi:hypothetical protein